MQRIRGNHLVGSTHMDARLHITSAHPSQIIPVTVLEARIPAGRQARVTYEYHPSRRGHDGHPQCLRVWVNDAQLQTDCSDPDDPSRVPKPLNIDPASGDRTLRLGFYKATTPPPYNWEAHFGLVEFAALREQINIASGDGTTQENNNIVVNVTLG